MQIYRHFHKAQHILRLICGELAKASGIILPRNPLGARVSVQFVILQSARKFRIGKWRLRAGKTA